MKQLLIVLLLLGSNPVFSQEEPLPPPIEAPKKEQPRVYVDEPAEFPGGPDAMRNFLAANIVHPETATEQALQGRCYVQFVVSKEGNISNVTVLRGVPDCPECDAEVVRVLQLMPQWKPASLNGEQVDSLYNLPVNLKHAGKKERRKHKRERLRKTCIF